METLIDILLDPVSLVVIAMYAGLLLWELPAPWRAPRADAAVLRFKDTNKNRPQRPQAPKAG